MLDSLVDSYFSTFNLYLSLLHRPTFQASVSAGLHMEDEGFASLLLMVCACGAKLSTDRRILSEGTENWHSAGWKYFVQVQASRRAISLRPPRLYDIQIPCVCPFGFVRTLGYLSNALCSWYTSTCMDHPSLTLAGRPLAWG